MTRHWKHIGAAPLSLCMTTLVACGADDAFAPLPDGYGASCSADAPCDEPLICAETLGGGKCFFSCSVLGYTDDGQEYGTCYEFDEKYGSCWYCFVDTYGPEPVCDEVGCTD